MDARALTRRMRGGAVAAVAVGLAIAGAAGMAAAAHGHRTVHVKQVLAAVGGGTGKGQLLLVVHTGKTALDGSLDVGVRHLGRRSQYEVLVDGVHVGGITTNGGGNGHARFRTTPKGHALVLGVDPRGKQVVIRDADGRRRVRDGRWVVGGRLVPPRPVHQHAAGADGNGVLRARGR